MSTTQLNMPRNETYHEVALEFQRHGIAALVYDSRFVGHSDGTPRNHVSPSKHVEDYHDAVTFLKSHSCVDAQRIAVWGYSLSGACALGAAALDPRVKVVVAICPGIPVDRVNDEKRTYYLRRAMQDRESQLRGNPPFYIPMVGEKDDGSVYDYSVFKAADENVGLEEAVAQLERIPTFRNEITMAGMYNMLAWSLKDLLPMLKSTAVLMVFAENEELEYVKRESDGLYNLVTGSKQKFVAANRGHMDILNCDAQFADIMGVQVDFLRKHLSL